MLDGRMFEKKVTVYFEASRRIWMYLGGFGSFSSCDLLVLRKQNHPSFLAIFTYPHWVCQKDNSRASIAVENEDSSEVPRCTGILSMPFKLSLPIPCSDHRTSKVAPLHLGHFIPNQNDQN